MLKTKTLEKRANNQSKKSIGLLLLLSSSLADFREHISKLHKVFRCKMCNFYHQFFYAYLFDENNKAWEKGYFSKEIFFSLLFLISSSMIVINLQLERGHQVYCNFLCKSKERFYKTCEVIGVFWKKSSSGWKNQFRPIFLVIPVMLLKTKFFEKERFWPSFFPMW